MASAPLIRQKQAALWSALGVELSSFALNLTGALLANSLTLWTNTLRVGLDALACLFALYVMRRIARGQNSQFDYGLGKWENLSALLNAGVMLVGIVFIAVRATHAFLVPHAVTGTGFGLAVLVVYSGLNIWMLLRFTRLRRVDPSPILQAQFVLYRNAASACLLSTLAVAATRFSPDHRWDVYMDIGGAVALAVIILIGMVTLLRQSLSALLDETVEESVQIRILRGLAESYEEYQQMHRIRTRRSGGRIYVELFLEFEPLLSVRDLERRSARIKALVENLVPQAEAWVVPCGGALSPPPAE